MFSLIPCPHFFSSVAMFKAGELVLYTWYAMRVQVVELVSSVWLRDVDLLSVRSGLLSVRSGQHTDFGYDPQLMGLRRTRIFWRCVLNSEQRTRLRTG